MEGQKDQTMYCRASLGIRDIRPGDNVPCGNKAKASLINGRHPLCGIHLNAAIKTGSVAISRNPVI